MRPTWAEISLPKLCRNFRLIQDYVGEGVTVCAVVKADAYGHGAIDCARGATHRTRPIRGDASSAWLS